MGKDNNKKKILVGRGQKMNILGDLGQARH